MRCLYLQTLSKAWITGVFFTILVSSGHLAHAQTRLWVAKNGNDSWSGTLSAPDGQGNGPKLTLEGARDAIRALKSNGQLDSMGAVVTVRNGRYKTLSTLQFDQSDSGASGARIVWRAENIGQAIIDGSQEITRWLAGGNSYDLSKIPAGVRGKIRIADLVANGIPNAGTLRHNAPNYPIKPQWADLIFDDTRMTLAKWPNVGHANMSPGNGAGNGFNTPTARFNLTGMRTPSFTRNPNLPVDYDHDYWVQCTLNERMYNMFQEKVDILDRGLGDIRIAIDDGNLMDDARRVLYRADSPGRIDFVNSMYELDAPGEYYIDRNKMLLYFYPPVQIGQKRAVLTMNPGTMVTLNGTSYLDLQGFVIEGGRQNAVEANNCTSVIVRGCKIRNCGGNAVTVVGGNAVTIRSCEIYEMGEGGISMTGGVRATFTRGNHLADNNYIHHVGLFQPFSRPGIQMVGHGLTARNNEISYHAHLAIYFWGNDIVIENNRIHHVVMDSTDAAAIYAGHDWTTRGNVIRYNYLADIRTIRIGYHIIHGIYLDDMFSSANIYGNVFRRVDQPIQLGGGHACSADRNVFVDCTGAVRIDDRGKDGSQDWIDDFFTAAATVPWQNAAWKAKYPGVYATLTSATYRVPSGNSIQGNVALRTTYSPKIGGDFELWGINQFRDPAVLIFDKNIVTNEQQFVDEPKGNFTPLSASASAQNGFQALHTSQMGVRKDTFIDPAKWNGYGY